MPTPQTSLYYKLAGAMIAGDVDWMSNTIKVALVNGYTFDQESHAFFDDVTGEISGGGYTAGGVTLAGKSVDDSIPGITILKADDPDFGVLTNSMTGAVMYSWTGSAATSPLIAFYDFGGIQNAPGINFSLFLTNGEAIYLSTAAAVA